jgi:phosphonate transport system substrate-binding protein
MLLRKLCTRVSIGLALLTAALVPAHAELTLGIHPFKPPAKLIESFTPLTNYLSDKLGEPVKLIVTKDYLEQIDAIGRGEIDIAYMGPTLYVKMHDVYGARPLLARQAIHGSPTFHSRIFVRSDSTIQSLSNLAGKKFAFGETHSTMSHLVPRYMLWQAGIPVEKLGSYKFLGDHVNVALGVLAGDFDAGAVKEDVYLQYEARGLRSIATSMPLSDHVFVASSKLSAEKVQRIQKLLQQLHKEARGGLILDTMTHGVSVLLPAQDSDYDSLRKVLDKMKELGVQF